MKHAPERTVESSMAHSDPLALVTIHGFAGTPATFDALGLEVDYGHWVAGHGPMPFCAIQSFEDEVERLARNLAVFSGRVHVVGYSMGARLALGLALRHPEAIACATLFGPNPGLESDEAREERLDWESRWIDVLEEDGIAVFEHKWRRLPLFDTQASLAPGLLEQQRQQRLCHSAPGLALAMKVLGLGAMPNYWPELSSLALPVAWAVGQDDPKFQAIASRAATLSSEISIFTIAETGHNPLLERPAEARAIIVAHGAAFSQRELAANRASARPGATT